MVRLHGIDTPEMDTPEGKAAREAAIRILESGMVTIRPTGQQTFARWVADVWVGGVSVAEALDKRGHRKKAKP